MAIINNSFIGKIKNNDTKNYNNVQNNLNGKKFGEILQEKSENEKNIMFSKHASMRLDKRNVTLTNNQMQRVQKGIRLAEQKGVTDSLVIVDNISLLVSVKNKTVVTAIDNNKNGQEKVYTNINGAVIV